MQTLRPHLPLLLLVSAGGILRLAIAWAPFEWLLRHTLSDDAFYYFTIARNTAAGFGLTFDRIAQTNGFHPLWLFMLVPIHFLVPDRITAVHVTLTLSALLDSATIYLLWRLLKRNGLSARVQLLIGSCYAFGPVLLSHAGPLNGLETALNIFLITAYLIKYASLLDLHTMSTSGMAQFGLLSGALFLARTDNALLLFITYFHLAMFLSYHQPKLAQLGRSAIVGGVVVLPWLLWSYLTFGSLIQVSGLSISFVSRASVALQGWNFSDYLLQALRNLGGIFTFFPLYLHNTHIISAIPLASLALLCAMIVAVIVGSRSSQDSERDIALRLVTPLLLVIICYVVIHTVIAVYMRAWYYTSLLPILFLLLGAILQTFLNLRGVNLQIHVRRILVAGMFLCLTVWGIAMKGVLDKATGEVDKYKAVKMISPLLPEGSTVGSWNAGVYGYFFEKVTVVDLDGLVNNAAYSHIRNRTLGEYCDSIGVEYLIDPPGSFRFWENYWRSQPSDLLQECVILLSLPQHGNLDTVLLVRLQ